MEDRLTFYHPTEEKFNVISHGIGLILSIFACFALISYASLYGTFWHIISFTIYGISLVLLYSASTLYHFVQEPKLRYKLNIFDHAAIYVLIAGSYTPFALNVIDGSRGWILLMIIWTIAVCGIVFKLFFTGKYGFISTVIYVLMGWLGMFGIEAIVRNLPIEATYWLIGGGISYTVGSILFGLKMIKFNHAIFHLFVLFGSFCHFMSVFLYILPYKHI